MKAIRHFAVNEYGKLRIAKCEKVSRISDDEKRSLANAIANLLIHAALRTPDQ
jgi:hypothetical protein